MGIQEELDSKDKKGLFQSDDDYIMYSTGILPLDYANGYWQDAIVDGERKIIPMLGITGGTFVTIIGNTGTGKTTLADQMAYNIIRPFKNSTMHHIDTEKTSNRQRIINLVGANYDDPRIRIHKSHASIDDVLEMVDRICDIKETGGADYRYEIMNKSPNGKPIKAFIPTVFIIDSLPAFNSKEYNVEDLGSNADQMRAAKDTTRFFTNCLDRAWKYNITFFIINHIRPKTEMNQYQPSPKGVMMLGPNETLPRGYTAQFYSNTYFRINSKKSDAYTVEDNGFTGYKCWIQMAKTKTNMTGSSFPVAFNSEHGFDPIYTLYEFAADRKLLNGKNPYLYFEGLDTFKFNRKDFRNKILYEKDFREAVLTILRPYLEDLLGAQKPQRPDGEEETQEETSGPEALAYGDLIIPY